MIYKTTSTHQFMDIKTGEIQTFSGEYSIDATSAIEAAQAAIEAVRKSAGQWRTVVNIQLSVAIDHTKN